MLRGGPATTARQRYEDKERELKRCDHQKCQETREKRAGLLREHDTSHIEQLQHRCEAEEHGKEADHPPAERTGARRELSGSGW